MQRTIPEEKMKILQAHGFDPALRCGLESAFYSQTVALDSKMLVQGDHATDYAYILYSCVEEGGEVLDGLFYSPSILEYMLLDFGAEWELSPMLKSINRQTHGEVRLVGVGGYPMLYTEICDFEWEEGSLRYAVSDMLKVVAVLDHLLPRKREALRKKRAKRNT